jgi:hypothetical protein
MALDDDIQQVGNGSIQTMTPGSAVAGQLQNILANKRLEARQNLLDQLNAQNVQSQISDRDANAQSMADYRKTQAAYRQSMDENRIAQEVQRRSSGLAPHQPVVGSDLDFFEKNAPSMIDPAVQGTQPLGPDEAGPTLPSQPATFHGLPVQLENERKRAAQQAYMAQLADPTSEANNKPDLLRAAEYYSVFGHEAPEGTIRPKVGGKVYLIDQEHGRIIDPVTQQPIAANSIGPNDKLENWTRPPKETTPNVTMVGQTPDGDPVFQTNRLDKAGLPVLMTKDGPYNGKVLAKDSAAQHKPTSIPTSEFNKLADLRKKAQPTPGFIQNITGGVLGSPNQAPQQNVDAYKSYAKSEAAKLGLSQDVQSAFSDVLDDPEADKYTAAQIAAGHTNLSAEDRAALQKIILEARAK